MSRDAPSGPGSASGARRASAHDETRRIRSVLSNTLHDVRRAPARALWLGVPPALAYVLAAAVASVGLVLAMVASVGLVYRMEEEYLIPLLALALVPAACLLFGFTMALPQVWFARRLRATWFSGLSSPGARVVPLTVAATLFMAGTTLGMILGALPGIMLGAVFELTIPAMIVHGLGMRAAATTSMHHFLRHPGWRTRFSLCNALMLYALWGLVPVIGVPLGFTVYALCAVHAYIAWFGDGPVPRRPG